MFLYFLLGNYNPQLQVQINNDYMRALRSDN